PEPLVRYGLAALPTTSEVSQKRRESRADVLLSVPEPGRAGRERHQFRHSDEERTR
ncbi:MAG: hypothetical protein JWM40_772, partial [Frankiales bacterium]|nr:hypothetical protein [Frankiales bacterium]